MSLPEVAERFVAVWSNPLAAAQLGAKLTNATTRPSTAITSADIL